MSESKLSMKLFIDTVGKRVVFAEAGKDCVDLLFYILSLPVSALVTLVGKQGMVGSLANLYSSLCTMKDSYIESNNSNSSLLNPARPFSGYSVPTLFYQTFTGCHASFYRCNSSKCTGTCHYYSDRRAVVCPRSREQMVLPMSYVAPPANESSNGGAGFVKGSVTYMVMDDLVVMPLSTKAIATVLSKFDVKNVGALGEKEVTFGKNEVVKLLNSSPVSQTVLTDVFIKGMK